MADFTISSTPLQNVQFQGNLQQTLDLFAQHLVGTYSPSGGFSVLRGQNGGTDPGGTNIGLWLNGNVLYAYNPAANKYLPFPVAIGRLYSGTLNITSILSSATANRTLLTPDKDGTIALLSDVYDGQPSATLTGAGPTLDWTVANQNFYLTLTANATVNSTGMKDGQTRHVWVENPANKTYTVTFNNVVWSNGGTPPTQTPGTATLRKIDHYKLYQVGLATFGEFVQNYTINADGTGVAGDVSAPVVSDISRYNANKVVYLDMNKLLQGGPLPTDAGTFLLKKQGAAMTITAANASGSRVTINTSGTMSYTDNITLQYLGSSIKDLAGNAALPFPATVVNQYTTSTGASLGTGPGQNVP